ncbi:MAG: XdhC family protein [Methyloceanibacter sp.]
MNLFGVQPARNGSHDAIETARDWLDEFGSAALATVVSTWGSSPVPVGGQLVVAPNGQFEGSVSGGCVEVDVIAEAIDVIAHGRPKLVEFGIADETAWRSGLPCGGTIKIFVEALGEAAGLAYLNAILTARRSRTTLRIVTDLVTGARRIFHSDTAIEGGLADIASGESRLIELAEGEAFLQVLTPAMRVVLAGATHIAQVLADLARRIGYDVVIVDPRTAFASEDRFSEIAPLTDWPEMSFAALGLDERTAMVALTHAAHLDDEALSEALRSNCLYVGALGSKKTHAKRLERLRAAGFSESALERIHAPVGLAIGAMGPAEIALSILAEIVQVARRAAAR